MIIMKKILPILLAFAVLASCARLGTVGASDDAKIYLEAWMHQNYPDAKQTELGAFIIEDTPGTGSPLGDKQYVRVEYTTQDLKGNYGNSTFAQINRQLASYSSHGYYGPVVWSRGENLEILRAGVEDVLSTMRIGGTRKAVIPGWLLSSQGNSRYDTAEDYVKYCSGTNLIYTIRVEDAFDDIEAWEKDSVARYIAVNYPSAQADSLEGWYYIRTAEPSSDITFPDDTTIYCNYTLMRLDGTVIDTSVEKVAKDNGIYSSLSSYGPLSVNMAESYTDITLGSDEAASIDGFAFAFKRMHPHESGTVIFWSGLGYSYYGSGSDIPAYCPLRYDIEIVDGK